MGTEKQWVFLLLTEAANSDLSIQTRMLMQPPTVSILYTDGRRWWYLKERNEFWIAPKQSPASRVGRLAEDPNWYDPQPNTFAQVGRDIRNVSTTGDSKRLRSSGFRGDHKGAHTLTAVKEGRGVDGVDGGKGMDMEWEGDGGFGGRMMGVESKEEKFPLEGFVDFQLEVYHLPLSSWMKADFSWGTFSSILGLEPVFRTRNPAVRRCSSWDKFRTRRSPILEEIQDTVFPWAGAVKGLVSYGSILSTEASERSGDISSESVQSVPSIEYSASPSVSVCRRSQEVKAKIPGYSTT
ncbi:hypothetical protein B0H11DRAFT_2207954 [Mycena galericulata]|nr:hypothetical protein B0H11DRAFT_2207954 [Mycena galericulata]